MNKTMRITMRALFLLAVITLFGISCLNTKPEKIATEEEAVKFYQKAEPGKQYTVVVERAAQKTPDKPDKKNVPDTDIILPSPAAKIPDKIQVPETKKPEVKPESKIKPNKIIKPVLPISKKTIKQPKKD